MRVVVQRVKRAQVTVGGEVVGRVGQGLLVLLGAGQGDGPADVDYLVEKVVGLRVFEDDAGKMNRALLDCGGGLLVVSQFTLYGDCRHGRRPSFTAALEPTAAAALCERFAAQARARGVAVETGRFGAMMDVELVNDGPVTLLLDSRKAF
jgi:D-tyrosyl-tRNA(Tyr) deacylase